MDTTVILMLLSEVIESEMLVIMDCRRQHLKTSNSAQPRNWIADNVDSEGTSCCLILATNDPPTHVAFPAKVFSCCGVPARKNARGSV